MVSLVLMIFLVSYPLLAASKAAGSDDYFAPWLCKLSPGLSSTQLSLSKHCNACP